VVISLLCAGFGIKLGMIPLHVWLPLAHPAAPTPASAVLSGAIIKTGLLGLLRTLPLGVIAMPAWGDMLLWSGLTACLAGALMGMAQSNPKTVLAYSSVSQMGLITMALGMALTAPDTWPLVLPAVLLLTVHHGIAKGALFLGVGVASARIRLLWCRLFVQGGLLLAALALAGFPLTMGYVAKAALKYSAAATDHGSELIWLLQLTSLATTLVVSRFLWLVWPHRRSGHGALAVGTVGPWAVLSAAVVVGFLVLRWHGLPQGSWVSLHPASLWSSTWPLAVAGLIVAWVLVRPGLRQRIAWIRVPEGDVVVPCLAAARWCGRHWNLIAVIHLPQWFHAPRRKLIERLTGAAQHLISRLSGALENDLTAGLMIVLLFLVLVAVSLW
jgi:formate hydrogenlyase subunit 3/multisubunit Na+/H+ antiporter MnhD subunit